MISIEGGPDTVRVYAHCAKPGSYPVGSVTLYALNLHPTNLAVLQNNLNNTDTQAYLLTPLGKLTSTKVQLNSKTLDFDGTSLPPMPGTTVSSITVPPQTFGFWVLPNANVKICS